MPFQHVLKNPGHVLAATALIAVAGLCLPTHYHQTANLVSSLHQERLSRPRKHRKRDKKRKDRSSNDSDHHDLPVSTEEENAQNTGGAQPIEPTTSGNQTPRKNAENQDVRDEQDDEEGKDTDEGASDKEVDDGDKEQNEDDDNPLDEFSNVINALELGKLQQAAAFARFHRTTDFDQSSTSCLSELLERFACEIHPVPKCGSYNLAYLITFRDGVKWIARVPGHGYSERWGDLDQAKMTSEYQTMEYVRANSSIPMPEIFYFNATCDFAGAPFALMSLVEGTQLAELWTEEMSMEQRMCALSDISRHMSQLYRLSFDRIGMLKFSEGRNISVGPDMTLESFNFNWWHATEASGPYSSFMESLWDAFDEDEDVHARQRANEPILRRALKSIPTSLTQERKFPLNFCDFNYQNILVDDNFRVTGFIDWDGVSTDSAFGCARYPSWITRDWDPIMYDYDKNKPFEEHHEESPEILSSYRQHYAAEFNKYTVDDYNPRVTVVSHIMEAIRIALSSPINRSEIVDKLLDHAFNGQVPFSKFEYVNDYVEGRRKKKDKLIEKAFAKMWHAEWEERNEVAKEDSASSGDENVGTSIDSAKSIEADQAKNDDSATKPNVTGSESENEGEVGDEDHECPGIDAERDSHHQQKRIDHPESNEGQIAAQKDEEDDLRAQECQGLPDTDQHSELLHQEEEVEIKVYAEKCLTEDVPQHTEQKKARRAFSSFVKIKKQARRLLRRFKKSSSQRGEGSRDSTPRSDED